MKFIALIILVLVFVSCGDAANKKNPENKPKNSTKNEGVSQKDKPVEAEIREKNTSVYEVRTVENASGWGYEVWQDGAMVIKQEHIPAVQGIRAFSSQEQAQKAAEIIKAKLDQGIFPPTMSMAELQSIGVDIK
jgi:Na+-transporting methylmalonyl-CoA/oxaloacetate decarboxylase gamma subunit